MSGLVEKVREKVRSRSQHRKSASLAGGSGRNSTEFHDARESNEISNRNSMQDIRRSRNTEPQNGVDGATRDFAAMNMQDTPSQSKNLPPLPTGTSNNVQTGSPLSPRSPTTNSVMDRKRPISRAGTDFEDPSMSSSSAPARRSSLPRKPVPMPKNEDIPPVPTKTRFSPGHKSSRSMDIAPSDPSPLVPRLTGNRNGNGNETSATSRSMATPTETQTNSARDPHLRLPSGFDLNNSEETGVSTRWAPAITRETIHHQRTEIVTKAIHRDVHIDHYHHYVQPILVTEILPAVHYHLDHKTGKKTEIAAPEGWVMPEHMRPRAAQDYSHLGKEERHYVVDEQNPNGKLEEPPSLKHKRDIPDMSEEGENAVAEQSRLGKL